MTNSERKVLGLEADNLALLLLSRGQFFQRVILYKNVLINLEVTLILVRAFYYPGRHVEL